MAKAGNQVYTYAFPHPFTSPVIEATPDPSLLFPLFGTFLLKPHDQLYYSGPMIEDIMFKISLEFEFRGKGRQLWNAYKSSPTDFDIFAANGNREATNLNAANTLLQYPVKWFPLYVRDIQDRIIELVEDPTWPDTIESAMARIFLNNTVSFGSRWNNRNRLPDTLPVPAPADSTNTGEGVVTLEPFSKLATGFPFPADEAHVLSAVPRMGIDFKGQAYVNRGTLAVNTSDEPEKSNFQGNSNNRWPRSVIGKRRIQEDVTIVDGSLVDRDGETVEGVASIHTESAPSDTDEGRPEQFRQLASEDSPNAASAGDPDLESGYSWFAHHPAVIEQLRFQPPHVENFDGGATQIRDYTENVFSNQTRNLPWHLSQPIEKVHFSDWGGWLMQGFVGMTGDAMFMRAYPDQQFNDLFTECPFPVFFPPSEGPCSCGGTVGAYGIWSSSTEALLWNELLIGNSLKNTGAAKLFGPKTRLRIDADVSLESGTGSGGGASFTVSIRTQRISSVNLQPFIPVMGIGQGATGAGVGPGLEGSFDINIMEAMNNAYSYYEISGLDAILAIQISVTSTSQESGIFPATQGPTGTTAPDVDLGCAVGTSKATIRKIYLFEPGLQSVDPRIPNTLNEERRITAPPPYNLPIVS